MHSTPESNTQVVQAMFAAFGRGDLPAVFAQMDPEIVWHGRYAAGVPIDGEWRGVQGVGAMFSKLGETTAIEAFAPTEFIAQGDKVVVLGHERVRVPATGKTYENPWVHVYTVRDGKVAAVTTYNDSAAVLHGFTP